MERKVSSMNTLTEHLQTADLTAHWIWYFSLIIAGLLGGVIGPYIVWNRLSLLSDTIAHASLFIAALALVVGLTPVALLIPFSVVLAVLIYHFQRLEKFDTDGILAMLFSGFTGMGLVIMHITGKGSEELLHLLFGRLQDLVVYDFYLFLMVAIGTVIYLCIFQKKLLLIIFNENIARIEGISTGTHRLIFLVLTALSVVICLKIMGVMLVTSLFVAPPLLAYGFSRSVRSFLILSPLLGILLVSSGAFMGNYYSVPVSASISSIALLLFVLSGFLFRRHFQ